jgi:putative transposase
MVCMARTLRVALGGYCYHVLNRGNGRRTVFHKDGDFHACVKLLHQADQHVPMRVLAFCLMPNHFHLALRPREDGQLSAYMAWLLTAHVRRYHNHYHSSGHIWQGRFKSFPIEEDNHLLTVLRYIERNPLRANLVDRAQDWLWSSAAGVADDEAHPRPLLDPGPVTRPEGWLQHVNEPQTEAEVNRLRESLRRGRPFGGLAWMNQTAHRLGLEATLRPIGRPRKPTTKPPSLFDDDQETE